MYRVILSSVSEEFRRKMIVLLNVLKSGTLLSATPERHSQNRERRRSATPFYQKERCGSGPHIYEVSAIMSGPLLSLFFSDVRKFAIKTFLLINKGTSIKDVQFLGS